MSASERQARCERPELQRLIGRHEFAALNEEERLALEAHVLECDICFAELELGAEVAALLRERAPDLARTLREPVSRRKSESFVDRLLRIRNELRPRVAVAAAVVLLAASAGVFVHSRLSDPARLARFPREELASHLLRGASDKRAVQELLDAGAAHFDLGHYAEAARRFHAALSLDPGQAETAYLAGLSQALAGEVREAIPDLELAARLAPEDLQAKVSWVLANAYLATGETAKAIALLENLGRDPGVFGDQARTLLERLGRRVSGLHTDMEEWLRGILASDARASEGDTTTASRDVAAELLGEARRHHESERLRPCSELASRAAEAATELGEDSLEVDARQLLGECLFELGLMPKAGAAFARAAQVARQHGDRGRELRALEGEARVRISGGRIPEALTLLHLVRQEAESRGDPALLCRALHGIGQCRHSVGERRAAVAAFDSALQIARREDQPSLEVQILQDFSLALYHSGDHEKAMTMQAEALQLARKLGRKREVVGSLVRAGMLCVNVEQYSRGLSLLREALPLAQELEHRRAILNIRAREASIYAALGYLDEALQIYDDLIPVTRKMQNKRAEAGLLRRRGNVLAQLERFEEASETYETALRVADELGNPLDKSDVLHLLGEMHLVQGDFGSAQRFLQRAIGSADSLRSARSISHWECLLGQTWALSGERRRAGTLYERATERARRSGNRDVLREVLLQRALLARQEGDLEAADRMLCEAIDLAETVRTGLAGTEHLVGFQALNVPLHVARTSVLYEIGMAERGGRRGAHFEAFRAAEQAKSRALLDVLGGIRVDPGVAADPAVRERELALLQDLRSQQTDLARAEAEIEPPAMLIDSLESRYERTSRALRETRQEIASRSPAYGALLGFREPLDVDTVRQHVLLPDQVLLEYLVGDDESFLFLVGADRFRMQRLSVGLKQLDARIAALRAAIQSNAPGLNVKAKELHAALLRPIADDLRPDDRLVVIPDGPLFQLPFAALHDGRSFLVERHAIAYAPSASVLDDRLQQQEYTGKPTLLAVGNPASFREARLLSAIRMVHDWSFGELPFSEEEVHRIARHFPRKHVLTGAVATEEAVKAEIGGATCVHFATHGLLDPSEPLMSGLVLAQDEDPSEDGFLQVYEILDLDLRADLVVLSACSTGLGRLVRGEGVVGLTRAFLHAGARQLLISLWEIGDRSTVSLMESFYETRFGDGQPADRSLQGAQRAHLSAGLPPRDWAAFILTGRMGTAAAHSRARR